MIASGSQHDMAYGLETAFGTQALAAAMKQLRYTGTTLNPDRDTLEDDEWFADRQVRDVSLGNKRPRGDINFNLVYGDHDPLIEAGLGGTWTANVLKNGVIQRSFTIERRFNDVGRFRRFLGAMVNTWNVDLRPGRKANSTLGIIAQDWVPAAAQIGAPAAASSVQSFETFTGTLEEGGVTFGSVTALTFTMDNNLDPAFSLFTGGKSDEVIPGLIRGSGRMSVWFKDEAIGAKFLAGTESSIKVTLDGPAGDLEIFIPRLKYTGAPVTMNGTGGITVDLPFTMLRDATTGTTIQLTRTP